MRIGIYKLILFFLFVFLILGLFFIQVLKGGRFYELSLKNTIRLISEEPYRGRIFDRNNILLADNTLSFDVVIIPEELKDKKAVFNKLSEILSITSGEIEKKYKRAYLNPFTPVPVALGITKEAAITVEEQVFDLRGVTIELNSKRFYPFDSCASHVLGYVGEIDKSRITKLKEYGYDIKDRVGYSGIEEKLDMFLRGEKGGRQIEVDSRGRQVRLLGYKPPSMGNDVMLTLDIELQQVSDKLLEGKKGAVVFMDIHSGEIFILSSAPAFSPNVFTDKKDKKALNYFLSSPDAPLFNRALDGQFPPGSVFKIVTALAASKAKKLIPSKTFICQGKLKVGGRYFKCWSEHGAQDFYQAMAHSCDVYFYYLGFWGGADGMNSMACEFGLSGSTGIDLLHEAPGFIPTRMWKRLSKFDDWYEGDTVNFSIGQGYVLTTPLQLARMMAAVANGGYLVEPRVTKSIGGLDVSVKEPKKIKVSEDDLELVKKSLRYPVSLDTGTAHTLDVKGLEICAKTGTAEVKGKESHGWVAGFFPLNAPRYAFCILLENAGSSHAACELGKQLFEEAVKRNKLLN